jgi:hypothetical protein
MYQYRGAEMAKPDFKPVGEKRRPTPDEMLAVARQSGSQSPPVVRRDPDPAPAGTGEPVVGLNLKVLLSTSEAVATAARERGVSMKAVVMQALAQAGVAVAALDAEDRTPARRKGK